MGLVIYEIIFAFWRRINRFKKEKEVLIIVCDSDIANDCQSFDSQIQNMEDQDDDIFQISDYIENDVDIVDYDNLLVDSIRNSSPNHMHYFPKLPHCNSLPSSPKSCSMLNRGLSSPYLSGSYNLQLHLFDNIYDELSQLKKDLRDIKSKMRKFSRQYYKISKNIDNCNNAVEELYANQYIHQLREFNEEESRSLELEERIKQLCLQLNLCEDAKITTITDSFPFLQISDHYFNDPNLMSPSLLYDEEWSTKESEVNQNRWSLDFDL